jgi:ABC-type multidrug transport system ATPase subunit
MCRSISAAQAKRVCIALALIGRPHTILLEDPTCSLDAPTANRLVTELRALASSGVTICATMSSPTPVAFSLCEHLLVLLRGEVAYHGPNGSSMLRYFTHLTVSLPARSQCNDDMLPPVGCDIDLPEQKGKRASTVNTSAPAGVCNPLCYSEANDSTFVAGFVDAANRNQQLGNNVIEAYDCSKTKLDVFHRIRSSISVRPPALHSNPLRVSA